MTIVTVSPKARTIETEGHEPYEVVEGGYCFHHYDRLPVFCSFLPGIGGLEGVPLWVMYLNRGQGVVSFGMRGKDNAVMEFHPATSAWQLAPIYGFRTFIRINGHLWEPFGAATKQEAHRWMVVRPHTLELYEEDEKSGLEVAVSYVSVPGSINPALLRTLRIRNRGSKAVSMEVLDGMPVIVPAGVNDFSLKKLRRITEAFCRVTPFGNNIVLVAPPVSTEDTADIQEVKDATFYGAWSQVDDQVKSCNLVVDPDIVFGPGEDFVQPHAFAAKRSFSPDGQNWNNRLPCAFAHTGAILEHGEELRVDSIAGYAHSRETLAGLVEQVTSDFDAVHERAGRVVEEVVEPVASLTAIPELDGYVRQNFLDNVLRGGVPVLFPSKDGPVPVHVYTRRHGDMERDYNEFELPPLPYSEGSGNFRDILQNRRNDVFFHPEIGASEITAFLALIQPDGYNPLAIKGYRWRVDSVAELEDLLPADLPIDSRRKLESIANRGFTPGELALWAANNLPDMMDQGAFVHSILERCHAGVSFNPPGEGYWVDHWVYLLDLLEAYQGVYPDHLENLLRGTDQFEWAPCRSGLFRQGDRYELYPLEKEATLPPATLLVRLCALAAIKALTLDEDGRGIEMEAGRPGWNDALNGLPGLRGSSTCETAALQRLCDWLLANWPTGSDDLQLPALLAAAFNSARALCQADTWDHAESVRTREVYREHLYLGTSREMTSVSPALLREMVASISRRTSAGLEASQVDESPLVHTYFYRENGDTVPMPLFLEGQVHFLRLKQGREQATAIHRAVQKSDLFDRELSMYKVNASLADCPYSIGRARTFSPGVYENESIWLHMSYKYLLELLRSGLHKEFFEDCRTMLVPFMEPSVYGRSILENSSFISSSACAEKANHGRGFVARLSGSTAEFIHIWLFLTVGERPFRQENGELVFGLDPILPADWFVAKPGVHQFRGGKFQLPADSLATTLLGTILLVYHNPRRLSTFGPDAVRPVSLRIDGEEHTVSQLRGELAERIRSRKVSRIDVELS